MIYPAPFNKEGLQTVLVVSGKEALKKLEKEKFALAIVDIRMPHIDGVELLRLIRRQVPSPPAVALSGYFDPEGVLEKTIGDLACGQLAKPFDNAQALRVIRKALGKA